MAKFLFIEGLPLDFFNPRSVVLFICILQGAVFAALLLVRYFRQRKSSDFWLAALLVLLCLSLVTPLIGFANVYDRNQWLTYFPFGIAYGFSVCVYFYVLTLTNSERKFETRDRLFFVPSVVYLIFRFFLFAQDLEFKAWFDENYYVPLVGKFIFVTELIWSVFLLWLSLRHYRKYRSWLDENFSDTEKIKFDWLRNFLYVLIFIVILGAVFDFIGSFVFRLSYIQYFYFELVTAFVTYYLAIAGYLRSQTIKIVFIPPAEPEKPEEPRKLLLEETELDKQKIKLQNLMQNEKPYLNPQLTLGDLARLNGVNSAVLSYIINTGFDKNFNDFVNEYRINAVIEKLRNGDAVDSTLLGVAFDCGFNSKATFNRAFKKVTDSTPKDYLEKSISNDANKMI